VAAQYTFLLPQWQSLDRTRVRHLGSFPQVGQDYIPPEPTRSRVRTGSASSRPAVWPPHHRIMERGPMSYRPKPAPPNNPSTFQNP
jgi:hypothetical protein